MSKIKRFRFDIIETGNPTIDARNRADFVWYDIFSRIVGRWWYDHGGDLDEFARDQFGWARRPGEEKDKDFFYSIVMSVAAHARNRKD